MSFDKETEQKQSVLIDCTGVSKCYKIYSNPKERLKQAIWRGKRQYYREFWALKDVTFNIRQGESLGIVGRNGSGKSTLLQIICGTLTPTQGNIKANGKIAALLELGSGFNPEFSGTENIYLNASMLGLSKEEIDAKLDDILAFADIGDYVNQPVKTYSSGMSLRLAFAVIAHVNADILVVDEALAVGDAVFVQRCMRFIRRMREEKCLLFVSHEAESVKNLCDKALWLSKGSIRGYGNCKDVMLDYLKYCNAEVYGETNKITSIKTNNEKSRSTEAKSASEKSFDNQAKDKSIDYQVSAVARNNLSEADGWSTKKATITSVIINKAESHSGEKDLLRGGEEVHIEVSATIHEKMQRPIIGFVLKDRLGQSLFGENTHLIKENEYMDAYCNPEDIVTARFTLWFPMLPNGEYSLLAALAEGNPKTNVQHYWAENAVIINVISSEVRYGLVGAFISNIEMSTIKNTDNSEAMLDESD